jgi:hypothetical protein
VVSSEIAVLATTRAARGHCRNWNGPLYADITAVSASRVYNLGKRALSIVHLDGTLGLGRKNIDVPL